MKEIVRQYGAVTIGIIVGLSLMILISGSVSGMTEIISYSSGSQLKVNQGKYENKRVRAKVSYKDDVRLKCGELYDAESYITIKTDTLGEPDYEICGIYDENHNRIQPVMKDGQSYLYFEEPGIYEIRLIIFPEGNRCEYGKFKVPVNR